jgi:uncharacterized protein (TIGR02996 family)
MSEEGFLQAITDEPDEDAHRLVYADWLDEQGNPERAEFIRVQCELARLPCGSLPGRPPTAEELAIDHARQTLQAREQDLLDRHARDWLGPLHDGVDYWWFDRGLPVVALSGRWWQRTRFRLGRLLGRSVLASLLVRPTARQAWRWVKTLYLEGADDAMLAEVAPSPHLSGLTCLAFSSSRIGPVGARALANSPYLRRLTCLDLDNNSIGPTGAAALAGSPCLARLTELHLRRNGIGDAGARALAGSPHLARLTELNLSHNDLGVEGAQALAASPHLSPRLWLHLHANPCNEADGILRARFERVTWGY